MKREDLCVDGVYVGKNGRRRMIRRFQGGFPHDRVIYDMPDGGVGTCTVPAFLRWVDRRE